MSRNEKEVFGHNSYFETCVDSVSRHEWDALAAGFADAIVDQTWAYASACFGATNLSNVVIRRDGEPVAAALVVLLRPPGVDTGIAFVKFGPMSERAGSESDPEIVRTAISCLVDEYAIRRGFYLRVVPFAVDPDDETLHEIFRQHGFRHQPSDDEDRFIVDLERPAENMRADLKSKWRYHLNKSEKAGLELERRNDLQSIDEFLRLYDEMRTHKKFADPRSLTRLPEIYESLPDGLKPEVWFCRHEGRAVAGAVVSAIGKTAIYLFGATDMTGRKLRAGYFLHWAIVNHLRDLGCTAYDLGGACGNAGLLQFKSGLVGKHQEPMLLPGSFDKAGSALSNLVARSFFGVMRAKDAIHERIARLDRGGAG